MVSSRVNLGCWNNLLEVRVMHDVENIKGVKEKVGKMGKNDVCDKGFANKGEILI